MKMPTDKCFHCHQEGHWVRNCPIKSGNMKNPNAEPCIQCPCGVGPCNIFTSGTKRNPDKKFYKCPSAESCNFFRWVDQVTPEEKLFCPEKVYPNCGCGAGTCRKEEVKLGPEAGRFCFVCRIKKSFGACGYFQWVDAVEAVGKNRGDGSSQSTKNGQEACNLVNEKALTGECYSFSDHQERRSFDDLLSPIMETMPISYAEDGELLQEFTKYDSSNGGVKLADVEATDQLHPLKESCKQISAADDDNMMEIMPISYDEDSELLKEFEKYDSANGRINSVEVEATEPLHPIKESCKQISAEDDNNINGVFSSSGPIVAAQDVVMLDKYQPVSYESSDIDSEPVKPSQQNPQQEAQSCSSYHSANVGGKRSFNMMDSNILKTFERTADYFRKDIVCHLDLIDPLDKDSVSLLESAIRSALDGLLVDHRPFCEHVHEFFKCASRLAEIEQSFKSAPTLQDLINEYNSEKVQFESVSRCNDEAVAAFSDSNRRLKLVRDNAPHLREMLTDFEEQLVHCEAEVSKNADYLQQSCADLIESQRRMQAASDKVAEAAEAFKHRDKDISAAKSALENARMRLRQ